MYARTSYYLTLISLFIVELGNSQNVRELHFVQEGKQIIVSYDLIGDISDSYFIELFVSEDGGLNWSSLIGNTSGDIGKNVEPGSCKKIIWDVLSSRNKLTGDIMFRLDAIWLHSRHIGQFTDSRDGQIYGWVKIGRQIWMSENLNYGVPVSSKVHQKDNGIAEKYCYDDIKDYCSVYGGLYQWEEAMMYDVTESTRGICPEGWHLPSDKDWCTLASSLDRNVQCAVFGYCGNYVGPKLRKNSGYYWTGSKNVDHVNGVGFDALGAGGINMYKYFDNLGQSCTLWTSTLHSASYGIAWSIHSYSDQVKRDYYNILNGYSVRCLWDENFRFGQ